MVERRIRAARFPAVKSFDTFDFTAISSLNKPLTLKLARCEYVVARENVIAPGNSGTGKTHACLALGLAACQRGFSVNFFTAAGLVHQLINGESYRLKQSKARRRVRWDTRARKPNDPAGKFCVPLATNSLKKIGWGSPPLNRNGICAFDGMGPDIKANTPIPGL